MPFPLSPPPIYDVGAWTWPRQLNKWLDVNPVSKLTRTDTFITLPAFTQASNTWNGYSDIVESFNFEGPNNFSLLGISGDIPKNPNYTLCISFQIGGTVTRYIIWTAAGSVLNQDIPQYVNQLILKNFRLEVWNTSQGIASQSAAINFYTSVLGSRDYKWAIDSTLVNPDSPCINFSDSAFDANAALPPNTGLVGWFCADYCNGFYGSSITPAGALTSWASCKNPIYDILTAISPNLGGIVINNDTDFNGHNSVLFDGSLQILQSTPGGEPAGSTLFNATFTYNSIIIFVLTSSYPIVGSVMATIAQQGISSGGFTINSGSKNNSIRVGVFGGATYGDSSLPASLEQSCLGCYLDNGPVGAYSLQNQTWFNLYYPDLQTFVMNNWILWGATWKCAEILVYTSLASDDDAQQLQNYLTTRYGTSTNLFKLPLTFPANAISTTN